MFTLSWVEGISTTGRSMRLALRMRVSMSEIGSVIMVASSPACFLDAGNQPVAGHAAEADAADAEFPIYRAGPAAQAAAEPNADLVARAELGLLRVAFIGFKLRQLFLELGAFGGG